MKKRSPLLPFLLLVMLFGNVIAANGGPDGYGYTWIDSNEPGGPSPTWLDTNANWVHVTGLADDNAVGPFNIGWNFPYYGGNYNSIKIGSNGCVSFSSFTNIASCFPSIPTPGGPGENYFAPLMSDLTFISSFPVFPNPAKCMYWSNNQDSAVISFFQVPFWQNGTPDWFGSNTFQIFLNGTDSSVTFIYQNVNPLFTDIGGCLDVVVGIESPTGIFGLECWREILPPSNYAIKFKGPTFVGTTSVEIDTLVCSIKDTLGYRHYSYYLTTINSSNNPGLRLVVGSQDGMLLSQSTNWVQNGTSQVSGTVMTLLRGNHPFFFDITVIDTALHDTSHFNLGLLLPNCDTSVCDGSLLRNGTLSNGTIAGYLGNGGATTFWNRAYGSPYVLSGPGYDDIGSIRLRGNAAGGDAVTQTLLPSNKIISGKYYSFSCASRLESVPPFADYYKIGVVAYNGTLPPTPTHPIASSSVAVLGVTGKLNSRGWTMVELPKWRANKDFDKVAIYVFNNFNNTFSSAILDDVCLIEVEESCDCDSIALDSLGQPIVAFPMSQYIDATSALYDTVDMFSGYTSDLYSGFYDSAIDTNYLDTLCVSIGGTVPAAALNMDFNDSLLSMGIPINSDSVSKILKSVGDSALLAALNIISPWSTLPKLESFCCVAPPDTTTINGPFCGRDIVFVHGLAPETIWNRITSNNGFEQAVWPGDAKEFYDDFNGNGYYGGWKQKADVYWDDHIQHFLANKGYRNRYITIAWPSTQGLEYATHAMLSQISEAMINGQGVQLLDANDPRGKSGFGHQGYVIVSHSTGGLITDVAMSMANMTKTNTQLEQQIGSVGYISDHARIHVGVQAAFSGSALATTAIAVFGQFPVLAPLLNISYNINSLSLKGIAGSLSVVSNSMLVDLIPQVAQLYWMQSYGRHTPVPVLTVAGGHPDRDLLVTKSVLQKGLDDGTLTMDCQCGNNNIVPLFTPSIYYPRPSILHANVFDMGIATDRAIGYYIAQIMESQLIGSVSSGCLARLSPTGMQQPILAMGYLRSPHHRYTNHYSFLQTTSDHLSGPIGIISTFPVYNNSYASPYNYKPTLVQGSVNNEEVRAITDHAVYDLNLVSNDIKYIVKEQIKGVKWTISFKFFGKKYSRSFWIWKRIYNRLDGFEALTEMDYVYRYVGCH